jgi:hypothetical protein
MRSIGTYRRVPQKTDERGWRDLREMLRKQDLRAASANPARAADGKRPSEYRAEYSLRRIIRRPGS